MLSLSGGHHIPYVGLVQSLSRMMLGTLGVSFPVPRKSAIIGIATVLVNCSEKKNILKRILMGIKAKKSSNHRTILSIVLNLLISFWCRARSSVGKTLVQKISSLPKETYGILISYSNLKRAVSTHMQINRISVMTLPCKHRQGVMEDVV